MSEVLNFIRNLNIENKCIVVAVSGGPDSMFLLDLLNDLKEELNLKIVVAHVNHNLRKESIDEAFEVEKYCKKNNIIFELKEIKEYPNGKFSEDAARKIRYKFFDSVVLKYKADTLFTAHHGDDLLETILMRITRGSSIKGYAGFERISMDRGYKIARPLVFLTKEEIEKELKKKNIYFATDTSNQNDAYTRNRYRKYILPELKKENKTVHLKFLEFNQKLLMVDKYLKNEAKKFLRDKLVEIDLNEFNNLDNIIKVYVIENILKETYNDNITLITSKHINIIIDILKKHCNTKFNLPLNKLLIVEYNKFRIVNNKEKKDYEYTFKEKINLPNGKKIYIDNNTKETSNYVIHLNSKDIKMPFHVRNRKSGDKMYIKNMNGSKSVSDIYTDFKLPKDLRDDYPIVTDDSGQIIWIPGIKKSHFDRKKEKNYDIILKYDERRIV